MSNKSAQAKRQLVEITDYIGRNCHELEGCAVTFTWKGETKAGTLQYNGMSNLSIRGLDYDTDYVLEVWPDGSVHRFWFAETPSFRAGRKQTVLLSQIIMI